MNINLLPRKSRIQKIFWPVMLSVIIIYALIALILVYAEFNNGASIEEKNEEIVKLQTEINSLRVIRQPDPLAEDFQDFQSDVSALKQFRRDWIQIVEQISTSLPLTSRVLSFQVNELGELEMESQFADLQQVAEYIAVLSESDSIESVNATNIVRVDLANISTVTPTNITDGALETIPGLTNQIDNTTNFTNPDDFIANLEGNITPPQDESERILNELRWLMEQKAAKEQHGILVPNIEMPDVPDFESWNDSGLFTPQEIESAWTEVDQYKEQTTTPSATIEKKIYVYQTTLTIKMAALDAGKEVLP
jgi:hypothetical protein